MKVAIDFERSPVTWNDICIYARKYIGGRRFAAKISVEWVPVDECARMDPSFVVPEEDSGHFIAALVDGLRRAGHLENKSAAVAELAAVKFHLEDMRALTFKRSMPSKEA